MTLDIPRAIVEGLIGQFRRAAIVTHFGYEDENDAMQTAGIDSAKQAIEVLDSFGSNARSALLPLLDDPDWSVRVFAASYLKKTHPQRALEVLKDIRDRCPAHHARWTALRTLDDFERGEPPP